jgi:hypothetical protein
MFERFHPVAKMEAARFKREFGPHLNLYEEDDLINWAYVAGFWKKYTDRAGAMRQIIRYSMLRELARAMCYKPDQGEMKRVAMRDEVDNHTMGPFEGAVVSEIMEIIENSGEFDKKDQDILLKRLWEDESFETIGRCVKLTHLRRIVS